MSSETIQALMDRYLPFLEAEMQEVVSAPSPDLHDLYGMLRYHLGWADEHFRSARSSPGKRLRPVLCLLACEACEGDWQQALPGACAVELVHNFSLIHDDIEDGDTTRRERPTVWAVWGLPQGLNAGDALFALAHLALLRLCDRGLPAQTVVGAIQVLDQACLRLTEGQFLDIRFENQECIPAQAYLRMAAGKTAALLAASCELGALVANASPSRRERMRAFGHHLGLAFQIQDDVLGIWGDPRLTGKPVGADLQRGKKTLPVVHAIERSPSLRALLAHRPLSPGQVAQAMEILEETGSRQWTEEVGREQTDAALAALAAADPRGAAGDALRSLARALLERVQ